MATAQTVQVAHLNGQVGYAVSNNKLDPSKPTWVLINSMCTTVEAFRTHFESKALTDTVNLLAIEPLGHGASTCSTEHFTYWDTALMALQAMEALGVRKAYALGTSQGGWIIVRMALLAPEKILGLLPLGTSMDAETADSRQKGCWDPAAVLPSFLDKWTSSTPTPDFVAGDDWIQTVVGICFGAAATPDVTSFWIETMRRVYSGDEGRRKLRMATICLADRDGLLLRLRDIKCPVHWLHGSADLAYSVTVAKEHIQLFVASPDARIDILEGGCHALNASHPKEIEDAILAMTSKS